MGDLWVTLKDGTLMCDSSTRFQQGQHTNILPKSGDISFKTSPREGFTTFLTMWIHIAYTSFRHMLTYSIVLYSTAKYTTKNIYYKQINIISHLDIFVCSVTVSQLNVDVVNVDQTLNYIIITWKGGWIYPRSPVTDSHRLWLIISRGWWWWWWWWWWLLLFSF